MAFDCSVVWDGTKLVAVGDTGTILTSPDGMDWSPRHLDSRADLVSVVWTGTQFVTVGDSGTIATSADGIAWTIRNREPSRKICSITWTGNQLVVAVNDSYTHATILTSPDGVTWTVRISEQSFLVNSVLWAGNKLLAVGQGCATGFARTIRRSTRSRAGAEAARWPRAARAKEISGRTPDSQYSKRVLLRATHLTFKTIDGRRVIHAAFREARLSPTTSQRPVSP